MNDQQFKIRIKLNQIPQSLQAGNPEETADQATPPFEKPPFDWRKISGAVILLTIILSGIVYWWLAEDTDSINNDSITLDKKTESASSMTETKNTVSDIPADTVDVLPATKPAISAVKPIPKPATILPSKKPETVK